MEKKAEQPRWSRWAVEARFLRKYPKAFVKYYSGAPKRWYLMGGNVDRHPSHHTILTAALGLFGALWAGLVFTTKAPIAHGIGWVSLGIAAYIFLSFFLPLWLPPIRDERKVALRRMEHERSMQVTIAALREAVAQVEPAPEGSPLAVAQGLIDRGSQLVMAEHGPNGPRSEAGSASDIDGVNGWLHQCRGGMAAHFAEQLYRVANPLSASASGADVVAAVNQTMPALQNFRNHYSKRGG